MATGLIAAVVRIKLDKAEEFLFVAGVADESARDAATSLAVSAAVNAADVISLLADGDYPSGDDHQQAVSRLRKLGHAVAAGHLSNALAVKHKAQYSAKRCTSADAAKAIKHAQRLLDEAIAMAKKDEGVTP